jgi:hypothetical protein
VKTQLIAIRRLSFLNVETTPTTFFRVAVYYLLEGASSLTLHIMMPAKEILTPKHNGTLRVQLSHINPYSFVKEILKDLSAVLYQKISEESGITWKH